VLHCDPERALGVMEHPTPHVVLRKGLIDGRIFPLLADHLGSRSATTHFKTSDVFLGTPDKRGMRKRFDGIEEKCRRQGTTGPPCSRLVAEPFSPETVTIGRPRRPIDEGRGDGAAPHRDRDMTGMVFPTHPPQDRFDASHANTRLFEGARAA
jgi:hypothetical protein